MTKNLGIETRVSTARAAAARTSAGSPISRRSFAALAGAALLSAAVGSFAKPERACAAASSFSPLSPAPSTLDLIMDTEIFRNNGWGNTTLVRRTDAQGDVHCMLCDGSASTTGAALLAWLGRLGVSSLDALFISHWHPDHAGALSGANGLIELAADAGLSIGRVITKPFDGSFVAGGGGSSQANYESVVNSCIAHGIPLLGLSAESAFGRSARSSASKQAAALMTPLDETTRSFLLGDAHVTLFNWEVVDEANNVLSGSDIATRRQFVLNENTDSLGVLIEADGRRFWIAGDIENFDPTYRDYKVDDHDAGTSHEGDEHRLAPLIGPVDGMQLGHHCYTNSNTPYYMDTLAPSVCTNTADANRVSEGVSDRIAQDRPVVEGADYAGDGVWMLRFELDSQDATGVEADGSTRSFPLRPLVKATFEQDGEVVATAGRYAPEALASLPELARAAYDPTLGDSIPLTPGARAGYDFYAWMDDAGNVAAPQTQLEADTVYKATWAGHRYTLAFDLGKRVEEEAGKMDSVELTYGVPFKLPACSVVRRGYAFDGWYDAEGNEFSDEAEVANLATDEGARVVFHAKWRAKQYRVKLDANGGQGAPYAVLYTYDQPASLPLGNCTRYGFVFDGWNTAADGSGDWYADGAEILNLVDEDGGEVVLYAQWKLAAAQAALDAGSAACDFFRGLFG